MATGTGTPCANGFAETSGGRACLAEVNRDLQVAPAIGIDVGLVEDASQHPPKRQVPPHMIAVAARTLT